VFLSISDEFWVKLRDQISDNPGKRNVARRFLHNTN